MALKNQPYIPLYVMDFTTDEKLEQCSAESTGVYIRLMCYLHKSDTYGTIKCNPRCLRDGEDIIAGFARMLSRPMPYDVDVIDRALRELIDMGVVTLNGDTLYQKRMVRDGQQSKVRSDAGAKGGKVSKKHDTSIEANSKQNESKTKSELQASLKQNTESENESEVETETERETENGNGELKTQTQFDAFWAAYPRKENKSGARKSWQKLSPDTALTERIMTSLERAKVCEQWTRDGGRYIPHAATWLNNARWEDVCASSNTVSHSSKYDEDLQESDAWMDTYLAQIKQAQPEGGAQNEDSETETC